MWEELERKEYDQDTLYRVSERHFLMLLKINSKYIKKCAQLLINVLIQPNELKEYSFRTAWGTCLKSQIWETKTE